jgi:hypothetical protein
LSSTHNDPHKNLKTAYGAVLFIGAVSFALGCVAVLFEVGFLERLGLGWSSILLGAAFLILARYTKRGSVFALSLAIGLYGLDGVLFLIQALGMKQVPAAGGMIFRALMIWLMARGIGAIQELNRTTGKDLQVNTPVPVNPSPAVTPIIPPVSLAMTSPATGPRPVSFVAPAPAVPSSDGIRPELVSKSLTPDISTLRFAAYRCEISQDQLKVIYQNASQREVKWYEVTSLVIRQLPLQPPWEGKLILDIIPMVVAGEKIYPVRVVSNTFVNYGFLPQGQSASTKENLRRLANFILSKNASIFIDPGSDCFVHAGQPPVRFLSMSQFSEYDSRYG